MNRELIINGKIMDLSSDTTIAVTYQANNIGDLQSRQGSYTNTFKLPLTSRNVQNLEFSHIITSNSLLPYRKLTATYKENGVESISDGDAQITLIDGTYIHLNIVSGNIDLVDSIGDLTVGELYEDDIPFIWETQSVIDSRDKSKYYIFPLIDWRSDIDTFFNIPAVSVDYMIPCALMTGLFSRLSDRIGFSFSGNYIDSDIHQNMFLTPDSFSLNPEYLSQDQTKGRLVYTTDSTTVNGYFLGSELIEEDSGVNYAAIYPIQNTFDSEFSNNAYTPTVNHIGSLKFNSLLNILWSATENYGPLENAQSKSMYIVTRMYKASDSSIVAEQTSPVISGQLPQGWVEIPVLLETGNISLDSSTYYFVVHDLVVTSHTNIESRVYVRAFNSDFVHTPTDIISLGSEIKFRDIFRMKVKDVLRDILNLRGIIIQTNSFTKEVKFNLFQDLVDNIPIAKDWSKKVDRRSFNMTFKFGNYAQKNWLRFKESDQVKDQLGDYYFLIDNENFDKEKTVVQIGHAATEQTNKYLGYNIPSIDAIDQNVKWQKPTYRILQLEIQDTTFNIEFDDGIDSQDIADSIPFARFVGFDELVPEFYDALSGILDRTKGIKIPCKLNSIDIEELDHTIPIFLDIPELNINGHFYLNKIENYKGSLTPCELIRL